MSIYSYDKKEFTLKIVCKTLLIIVLILCISNLAVASANANRFTFKLYNNVGEPIHLRSSKVTGFWVDDPVLDIMLPPKTINDKEIVKLRASDRGFLSPTLSGSLIYEVSNYGRTSGRVEISFSLHPKHSPQIYCVPDQRCKVDKVHFDSYNQPMVDIHIIR